jgi:hypothetical protein
MVTFVSLLAAASIAVQSSSATGAVEITVVNTWQAPYAAEIGDLSYVDYGDNLAFRSNADGKIYFADPDDGSYCGEIPIPAGCVGFGFELWDDSEYYLASDSEGLIYHGDGASGWDDFANPAGTGGSALTWDFWGSTNELIEACSSADQICVFDTSGAGAEFYTLPGITGTISGLAAHQVTTDGPASAPFALVVTCSDNPMFYFFHGYGGSYYQYDQEPCPVAVQQSLGLAYFPDRQSFFWSYRGADGEYYVSELFIPILGALDEATWAEIKTGTAD